MISTISGKSHFPEGTGDVCVSWRDDENKIFERVLKDVLFFSGSPVKIISPLYWHVNGAL